MPFQTRNFRYVRKKVIKLQVFDFHNSIALYIMVRKGVRKTFDQIQI